MMSRNGQEVLYEGWLTKSPPTKRIWRARWRRRWFSLQHSGELPGQFLLTYYTDRNCRKLKGTIDLDHCEQVDTGLKFEDRKLKFDHMFDIKTPTRTYYLAADTEDEMKAWVNCICNVCGLKATSEEEEGSISTGIYDSKGTKKQSDAANETNKGMTDSPPVSPVSTGPYIPISECITGRSPTQGAQDFYTLLQLNIRNSYFRSDFSKSHNNQVYDSAPTYLNDIISDSDPRFYDCPRSLRPQKNAQRQLKDSELYTNLRVEKNVNSSPLQSPTDSESVFTDDDWTHNTLASDNSRKNLSFSENSVFDASQKLSKVTLEKTVDPPPRPPKPSHAAPAPNYFNLPLSTKNGKEISEPNLQSKTVSLDSNALPSDGQVIMEDMYDFPRSHQLDANEAAQNVIARRHCYNNAAPVTVEGQIFRYDISPKPSTSTTQVFRYDSEDIPDEPASPVSQSSTSTTAMYSNLPSPLLPSDSQLMPPPMINRSLKPKRKLSDSVSVTSNPEPSSPRLAPSVDRTLKPPKGKQGSMRKAYDSDTEKGRKVRAAPSPTPLDLTRLQDSFSSDNEQIYHSFYIDEDYRIRGRGDLSNLQYLDLDHSASEFCGTSAKSQPLRSPGASTVYKKVDFMKTEAFNITRQHVEKERKEPVTYKK